MYASVAELSELFLAQAALLMPRFVGLFYTSPIVRETLGMDMTYR